MRRRGGGGSTAGLDRWPEEEYKAQTRVWKDDPDDEKGDEETDDEEEDDES